MLEGDGIIDRPMVWLVSIYAIGAAAFTASSPETTWFPRIVMALAWPLWLPLAIVGLAISAALLLSAKRSRPC
jgi:hypothetical protein